jgi:hypothetical protein
MKYAIEINSMPTPLCHSCQHLTADPRKIPCGECRGLFPKSDKNYYDKRSGW